MRKVLTLIALIISTTSSSAWAQGNTKEKCGYENGLFCRNDWIGIRIENSARILFTLQEDDTNIKIPRYRINLDGYLFKPELTFKVSGELADGQKIKGAYLNWLFWASPTSSYQVRAGRFKAPFSRQALVGTNSLTFLDRSAATKEFLLGRISGAELDFKHGKYVNARIGFFQEGTYAGRILFGHTGGRDYAESDWRGRHYPEIAFAVNYARDGGKNRSQVGYDLIIKFRGASLQIEKIRAVGLSAKGSYVQGGYFLIPRRLEVAARHSRLTKISGEELREKTFGINYYPWQHRLVLKINAGRTAETGSNPATMINIGIDFMF